MKHSEIVAGLRRPDFYGPEVDTVDFQQTHISWIFLTGKRAYKLKKPVNFGFLDFSTRELREHYCRAELELNRRLVPDVYLDVRPVVLDETGLRLGRDAGSPPVRGQIVDWLVEMRQMDGALQGTALAARGELRRRHIEDIVALLVPFYRDAATGSGVKEHGSLDAVRYNTDENFAQTEGHVGKLVSRERYEHIRKWTDRFYEERGALFAERVRGGRVRECHGDLHLGNIFFEETPVVFDCIEFSKRLRCGDVASDLAFLAMDLDYRGRPDLSAHLIERYVAASRDQGVHQLLDFYKCYRATVRAKVHCITSTDPGLGAMERRHQRNLARHHFGLAYSYAGGSSKPPLVVVYGLMGTGKTLVARGLRETYGWHVLSTDAVRKQMFGVGESTRVYVPYNSGLYSPETSRRTYEEVCSRAENLLRAGFPVAVDGAFKTRDERQPMIELARRAGARLLFLQTVCKPAEQRRRLEIRQLHDTRSDGRVELMERQRLEWEPADARDQRFATLETDGTAAGTHKRAAALLRARGLLPRGLVEASPASPPPTETATPAGRNR